jgi:hypothetical protein
LKSLPLMVAAAFTSIPNDRRHTLAQNSPTFKVRY